LELLLENLDQKMFDVGNDLEKIKTLQEQKQQSENELEQAMERWEELEEEIAGFEEY